MPEHIATAKPYDHAKTRGHTLGLGFFIYQKSTKTNQSITRYSMTCHNSKIRICTAKFFQLSLQRRKDKNHTNKQDRAMRKRNYNLLSMEKTDLAIGELIRKKLKESGHTVVWFANTLQCSRTNIYKMFKKKTIETDELFVICEILGYDFFKLYSKELQKRTKK